METVREKWTDERLDDLKEQVVTGFERVHADLQEIRGEVAGLRDGLRGEIKGEFASVREEAKGESAGLRAEMRAEFAAVRAEMAANHRLQVQLTLGTIGTVVLSFLGLLLSHA
jgi:hypothetical protein